MKKILYSLLTISGLFLTGCATFDDPVVENYGEGPKVTIKVTEATDTTFTFTVTPAKGTQYYSVLVDESALADSSLVASSLLKGSYSGVYNKVINAATDSVFTFNMCGADGKSLASPNTVYQIYAVAANDKGVVGEIAIESAITGDEVAPRPTGAEYKDKVMYIQFSENVARGEGAVKVDVYKENDLANVVTLPAEEFEVAVSGAKVGVAVPTTYAGAIIAVSWEEGAFVDSKGNKCPAFNSGLDYTIGRFSGACGQNDYAALEITDENVTAPEAGAAITEWEEFMGEITLSTKLYAVEENLDKALSVTYANDKTVKTINLSADNWAVKDSVIFFTLPEAPLGGDIITVNVAAGAVTDVYGNPNEAYAGEETYWKMISFVATDDMMLGIFKGSAVSKGQSGSIGDSIIIERVPELDGNAEVYIPENGKAVKISNLLVKGSEILGYYDLDEAVLYVANFYEVGTVTMSGGNDYGSVTYNHKDNTTPWIPFELKSDGTMTSTELGWVYTNLDYSEAIGWIAQFSQSTFTKIGELPAEEPASAKAFSAKKMNVKSLKALK